MRTIATILLAVACTGCAGLNVSWALTASYNTPATTTVVMTPGATPPARTGLAP